MTYGIRSTLKLVGLAAVIFTNSACEPIGRIKPPVSDFCLNYKPVTVNVRGTTDTEDATNMYDTDETIFQVFGNNGVHDSLCKQTPSSH